MLHRIQAQLRTHGHPNRQLQRDWDSDGPEAFHFEVSDLLEPSDSPDYDPANDLRLLEELWLENRDSTRSQVLSRREWVTGSLAGTC